MFSSLFGSSAKTRMVTPADAHPGHPEPIFDVPATPKDLRTPRRSAIPTLLLSGTFDAVTPPGTAVTAAETLSRATVLAFAGVGHAVVQSSPCAAEVFASFLDDPGAPGVACVGTLTPPVFATGG